MPTTQTLLEQARAALHDLVTGQAVVEVRNDGILTRYTAANQSDLERYISRLEQSAQCAGGRRPFGVNW